MFVRGNRIPTIKTPVTIIMAAPPLAMRVPLGLPSPFPVPLLWLLLEAYFRSYVPERKTRMITISQHDQAMRITQPTQAYTKKQLRFE